MSKWQRHYVFFCEDGYSMLSDETLLEEVKDFFIAYPEVEESFIEWCATRYANRKMDEFDEYQLTKNDY